MARVCQHISDEVSMNYVFPTFNDALGMGFPANSTRSSLPNQIKFGDTGFSVRGSGLNRFSVRVSGSVTTGLMSVGPLSD